jgi:hypothetical protein
MNFQGALTLLKQGKKLRRKEWLPAAYIASDGSALNFSSLDPGRLYLCLYRPTAIDLFADDWEVAPEPESGFAELSGLSGRIHFEEGLFEWNSSNGEVRIRMSSPSKTLESAKPITSKP